MPFCLPPLVPLVLGGLVLGGREGALGEWPVCMWPVAGAPSAAPTASPAATGKGSDRDAGTVDAADGAATGSALSSSSPSSVSVLPYSASSLGSIEGEPPSIGFADSGCGTSAAVLSELANSDCSASSRWLGSSKTAGSAADSKTSALGSCSS